MGAVRLNKPSFIILCSLLIQIVWENRLRKTVNGTQNTNLDGIHFPYRQSRVWNPIKKKYVINKKLYSEKLKGPGLGYQIASSMHTSDIVFVDGPYLPGEHNDIEMFRRSGLAKMLNKGERINADQGYVGEDPEFFVTPEGMGPGRKSKAFVKQKKRNDGRTETFNTNWTSFNIMTAKPFRHSIEKHALAFYAIAALTQVAIEMEEVKIYPAYIK